MEESKKTAVSIIVPVYNVEKYLPACIESILNQSYPHLQVILSDDGSTDNSGVICDQYAERDRRITVIHQKNGGVSSARNAALELAEGRYVTFCDSDDRYRENWITELVAAMEEVQSDIVIGNYVRVQEDGAVVEVQPHEAGTYTLHTPRETINYILSHILGELHGWECCMRLFRGDILRQHRIRFCEICENFAEDLGFVLEYMLYVQRVVSIPAVGYLYLIRDGSMMNRSYKKIKLNALNETTLQFLNRAPTAFGKPFARRWIPVLHYAAMYTEYRKFICFDYDCDLNDLFGAIRNKRQWRKMTAGLYFCWKELKELYGVYAARTVLVMAWCFLLRDWRLFRFWCRRMKNSEDS